MPFLNDEQIMRSSCPFEKSRRKSIALTGTPRLKTPGHLPVYNTPSTRQWRWNSPHCHQVLPWLSFGRLCMFPFLRWHSGRAPQHHSAVSLPGPHHRPAHLPELHLDHLRSEIWFRPEQTPLGAGMLRSQSFPSFCTCTTPTLTRVFQHCVLLFKKTKLFCFGNGELGVDIKKKIERKSYLSGRGFVYLLF